MSIEALFAIMSSFGALWLLVEIFSFFFANTGLPDAIRNEWPIFGAIGLFIAAFRCRPRLVVSCKLNGRDVIIEIAVGDLFSFPGAIIIGSNTTFDTRISSALISERSIQGLFTKKYYDSETSLDTEITGQLNLIPNQDLHGNRVGKSKKYSIGHCVRVNPKGRTGYLLAIANINEHGVASSSFDDLKESLAKLWVFIGQRGSKEPLVTPVLGTGFSRLPEPRDEVIREMIKSFLAACSEKTFTDKLTIVISPHDMTKHRICFKKLASFLAHQCDYTIFPGNGIQASGTPIQTQLDQ